MPSGAERLRVGILGLGVMGRRRRALIDRRGDMMTVAVCDPSGVPDAGAATVCADLARLLGEDLDALFVCATPAVAASATIEALRLGVHVFCEKPPARRAAELDAVIAVEAERPGIKLQYGFNHRRHQSVKQARALLASGALGRLVGLRGVYGKSSVADSPDSWRASVESAGGGILLDQGIHLLDLVCLFGGGFDEVHAFIERGAHGLAVEDNAWALLRSPEGVVASLHSSATEWRHRFSLEIALTEGSLHLDGLLTATATYAPETLTIRRRGSGSPGRPAEERREFDDDRSFGEEIDDFARAIRDGSPVRDGSSADALACMRLVERIYAADPGRPATSRR